MQGLAPPPYTLDNPVVKVFSDLRAQRRASRRVPLPPGPTGINPVRDLVSVLLRAYGQHGPIFTVRFFHGLVVVMLGLAHALPEWAP